MSCVCAPLHLAGWLSDILDCELKFEESCYKEEPDVYAKKMNDTDAMIKCFDGKGAISGKLIILPPEGRSITHNGVEIIFKSTACARDRWHAYLSSLSPSCSSPLSILAMRVSHRSRRVFLPVRLVCIPPSLVRSA